MNQIFFLHLRLFLLVCCTLASERDILEWTRYHSNAEVGDILKTVNLACPNITHLYRLESNGISKTIGGNVLNVIAFGKRPEIHEPGTPEFKYIGNMHGDEVVGRELLLNLVYHLCKEYRANNRQVRWLVDHTRIHILPTMNPDGYDISLKSTDEDSLVGRLNRNNVDLNRNFPNLDAVVFRNMLYGNGSLDHLYQGPLSGSQFEIETSMIMNWLNQTNFVLSANLHGGSLVVNFPYDDSPTGTRTLQKTPDHEIFVTLARSYADQSLRMKSGETICDKFDEVFDRGIVNGAQWYPINGSMQDYNYLATNAFELTIELGCRKAPPSEELPRYWWEHKHALVNLMFQTHMGIKGLVYGYDGQKWFPIPEAIIHVTDATERNNPKVIAHNIWSGRDGDYYRLLTPGLYLVRFEAPGFDSAATCVTVLHQPNFNSERYHEAKVVHALLVKSGEKLLDAFRHWKLKNSIKFDAISHMPAWCYEIEDGLHR